MLAIQTSKISVITVEDITDDQMDEIASDLELGISAIEERLKEKFPRHFERLEWDMD